MLHVGRRIHRGRCGSAGHGLVLCGREPSRNRHLLRHAPAERAITHPGANVRHRLRQGCAISHSPQCHPQQGRCPAGSLRRPRAVGAIAPGETAPLRDCPKAVDMKRYWRAGQTVGGMRSWIRVDRWKLWRDCSTYAWPASPAPCNCRPALASGSGDLPHFVPLSCQTAAVSASSRWRTLANTPSWPVTPEGVPSRKVT